MEDNEIFLRSINEFNGWTFIIKDYQRGYRWNKQQVEDLLNDLEEFRKKTKEEPTPPNEIYCLQPIIIKKIKDKEYELIDGQQRLTTIYILLKHIRKLAFGGTEKIKYDIRYETKDDAIKLEDQKSSYFLNNIDNISLSNSIKNLDYYFMKNAYNTIKNWFSENIDLAEKINDLLTDEENNKIKFICFEIANNNTDTEGTYTEKIFSRINNNQIKLTDSELIKAQILFNVGFNKNNNKETNLLKQINISNEWNKMESTLYNDNFWYFLSNENNKDNRTKIIFDFLAQKYDNVYSKRKYDTFEKIMKHLKNSDAYDFWNDEVKKILNILREWYENTEMYNYIGYLNNIKHIKNSDKYQINLKDLLELYDNSNTINTKDEFIKELKDKIKYSLKNIKIDDLTYQNDNDKEKIKSILLLFNVLTTQKEPENEKFPYNQYNKYKWEIEHLHPQNEKEPSTEEEINDWKDNAEKYIELLQNQKNLDEEKKNRLKKLKSQLKSQLNSKNIKEVYDKVTDALESIMDIDIHQIGNLALLDKDRNIDFSNKFFNDKREKLINGNINKDNKIFTPICTRNVFLKVYSENPENLSIWTKKDMEDYQKKMKQDLKDFITIGDENK